MFPFKDDNPTQTFPFVTIGIITINILAYVWEILSPAGKDISFITMAQFLPGLLSLEKTQVAHPTATVFHLCFFTEAFCTLAATCFTSGYSAIILKTGLGHFRFLIFYLVSGIIASYAHAISSPSSTVPMIGASGAVAGVLGAYILLFPHASVHTLIFFGFFIQIVKIPALIVIGFWAIIQLVNGILSQGLLPQGGVAWFAHIGGFLTGILTIKIWLPKRRFKEWS